MTTVAKALGVSRSNLSRRVGSETTRPRGPYAKPDDQALLAEIAPIVDARGSYGYRRVAALVSREREKRGKPRVNHKRVYRVMKVHNLLLDSY